MKYDSSGRLRATVEGLTVTADTVNLDTSDLEAAMAIVGTRSYDDANGQHVAYTAAAAQSAAITGTEVTIVSSTDCYVKFGSNPTATVGAGSMFLAAGVPFTRRITTGWKASAIRATADGALSIMPVA